ncbi:hypothetical protein SPRG_09424 [Saprolegnia parasitica CBS 223.65]|uniref:PH domain-containing protein n=1 Tax=Saprolegnia parasitica (strain CBS 223.65) TaxID=695850 RepID=A0A067CFZ3_SAPPC|nr:hypothetical protein SPRG_09424 [Saprolegnia parasitica CBS 223.65]KDO25481.1 hypothetical protein SPRG_09424 [Saprolegnia parasitica CBS 223.65]|eukprot:XP_012203906.1 hypothetical protein SPRG_09424 [Saprolegnia parasitica CBS 223.65]
MSGKVEAVTQPPLPPEIEGYLYKMKRQTGLSNLTGSWNRRWFYIDKRHKAFGYAINNTQPRMKNAIFLNDITAVVVFDEYCFQVEAKSRKFFLKAESKTSAACWVKTLDAYRTQQLLYEKHLASTPIVAPAKTMHQGPEEASPPREAKHTNQRRSSSSSKRRAEAKRRSYDDDDDVESTPVQAWSMTSDDSDDDK